jgi:plastocyanin
MSKGSTAVFLLVTFLAATADAQTTRPSVSGTVKVEQGKRIPGMIVYLESADPAVKFPAPIEPAIISQQGAKFTPSILIIAAGTRVDFLNDENRPIEHNVFSQSPAKQFDLGLWRPPVKKSVVFDQPGLVRLFCSIHRYMDGVIYVCPTPFFATVSEDGTYSISNVAPGEYVLKTWQRTPRYTEQSKAIKVIDGQPTVVHLQMSRK